MKYENDNKRKGVNIETNYYNYNEGTNNRVAKGNFVIREWPHVFLVESEMACFLFFLVNRDFIRSREP